MTKYLRKSWEIEAMEIPFFSINPFAPDASADLQRIKEFVEWLLPDTIERIDSDYFRIKGGRTLNSGAMLIRFGNGEYMAMTLSDFHDNYEEIPDDPASSLPTK